MRIIQRLIFGTPEEKWKNGCGILFLILGILSFFVCLLQAFGQDIWFDEVFSVNFIQHSYKEIASLPEGRASTALLLVFEVLS